MSRLFAFAGVLLLTLGWAVVSVSADEKKGKNDQKPWDDAEFVKMAASGGMLEVDLGKLAKDKATDADVRKFGERMVTDHTKANKELVDVAKSAGFTVPTKLLAEHQKHLDMLKKDKNFDRDYMKHMVEDHEEDVSLFDRATKEAKSADLKAFATKTLPTLKEHLQMAKTTYDKVK